MVACLGLFRFGTRTPDRLGALRFARGESASLAFASIWFYGARDDDLYDDFYFKLKYKMQSIIIRHFFRQCGI